VFQELKRYLTSPPVLVVPERGEPLLLYIAATSEAMSMVLVTERPGPHDLHELGSSSADGSEPQDPGHTEEPRAADGLGSLDSGSAEEP
jgi:dsDNA-binding SOS-regulon protein